MLQIGDRVLPIADQGVGFVKYIDAFWEEALHNKSLK
jgi:hypothetical protein